MRLCENFLLLSPFSPKGKKDEPDHCLISITDRTMTNVTSNKLTENNRKCHNHQ